MKKWKQILFSMVFVVFAACVTENACAAEPYEKIANANEWKVLKIVNKERLAQGLEPLSMFAGLQNAAEVRAEEIIDYFAHTRPDGTTCFTAIREQGIDYMCAGENIAAGYTSPTDVMSGWMNSAGHRSNILGSAYDHIGVGYCTGGSYGKNWVQVFIGGCSVKSVTVNDKGTANYPAGTSVDAMNRYLIVRCSHGISYVPVTSQMCSGYHADKTGYQTITVRYCGKKVKIPVTTGSASTYKRPAKVKNLKAVKTTKKTISLSWSKQSGKGYEVWVSTSKNGVYEKTNTLTSANRTSCKVKNLKSGKKYYIKIRAYKKINNKKIYGLFSKAVVVKTK